MATSILTSKGQITIPAQVRHALGVNTGDRIEFVELAKGQFVIIPATGSVQALKGMIPKPTKPVSIEEMNAAIRARGLAQTKPEKP